MVELTINKIIKMKFIINISILKHMQIKEYISDSIMKENISKCKIILFQFTKQFHN